MNKLLVFTRSSIPYIKQLNDLTAGPLSSLLMQQLEYRFSRSPNGFYKFMKPPAKGHVLYRAGDSWTEELGFSKTEFRNAYDVIGCRHGSKTEFLQAEDRFKGKFYASYVDKQANVTHYFRNHSLVDTELNLLIEAIKADRPYSQIKAEFVNRPASPAPQRIGMDGMKNHLLSFTRNFIPYIRQVNAISNGVTATLLLQQLEYWFEHDSDGFSKFTKPPTKPHFRYKPGESWCEELGLSPFQFKSAFKAVGIHYRSKTDFEAETDPFKGKFYASYTDRKLHLTYYFRNHQWMDYVLDTLIESIKTGEPFVMPSQVIDFKADHVSSLRGDHVSSLRGDHVSSLRGDHVSSLTGNEVSSLTGNEVSSLTRNQVYAPLEVKKHDLHEIKFTHLSKSSFITSRNQVYASPEVKKHDLPYTEPTEPITKPTTTTTSAAKTSESAKAGSSSNSLTNTKTENQAANRKAELQARIDALHYPSVSQPEVQGLRHVLLTHCAPEYWQQILDETEGRRQAGFKVKGGAVGFARALAKAASDDEFSPNLGLAVLADREKQGMSEVVLTKARKTYEVTPEMISEEMLSKMPAGLQKRHRAAIAKAQQARNDQNLPAHDE